MTLNGSLVALVTPFTQQGSIDYEALKRTLSFQISSGTSGLVIAGTTGEGSLLSIEEKKQLFNFVRQEVKEELSLIANISDSSTDRMLDLATFIQKIGYQAALITAPSYIIPSFRGVLSHFRVLNELNLPWIFYHHPKRTGCSLTEGQLLEILEFENLVGVKDCANARGIIPTEKLFLGNDADLFEGIEAKGIINVIGNVLPSLVQKWLATKDEGVGFSLQKVLSVLDQDINPQSIKYAMSVTGLMRPVLRRPYMTPPLSVCESIESEINRIRVREEALKITS